jgi:hypothetical protein
MNKKSGLWCALLVGLAMAGSQSASYQLPTFAESSGPQTTLNSTNYRLPAATIPAIEAGRYSSASYSGTEGVISQYSTAPNIPVVTGITPTNNTKPTWSWSSVSGATKYRWSYDDATWTNSGALTSYTPGTSLAEGSTTLYVQAGDDASNWSASGSKAIFIDITAPTVPGTPQDGGATTTSSTVIFTWTAATDNVALSSYVVQISTSATFTTNIVSQSVGLVLAGTLNNLPGDTYYCRVRAVDSVGNSSAWAMSDGITITTPRQDVIELFY